VNGHLMAAQTTTRRSRPVIPKDCGTVISKCLLNNERAQLTNY